MEVVKNIRKQQEHAHGSVSENPQIVRLLMANDSPSSNPCDLKNADINRFAAIMMGELIKAGNSKFQGKYPISSLKTLGE